MKPAPGHAAVRRSTCVELLEEAGTPAGVVNLVLGPGDRVGQALADSPGRRPDLAHRRHRGRSPAPRAARPATSSASPSSSAARARTSSSPMPTSTPPSTTPSPAAFVHSGQVCSAGCRAIVEDAIYDRFVDGARPAGRPDPRSGHGSDDATEAGALISRRPPRQGRALRPAAPSSRAPASSPAARRPDEPDLQAGFYVRPTVFADVRRDMTHHPRGGLRAGPHRRAIHDRGRGHRARQRHDLRAGRCRLDGRRGPRPARRRVGSATARSGSTTTTATCPEAEWGGFKQSGIGRELGPSGLDEYREAKHIWQNTAPGPDRLVRAGDPGSDRAARYSDAVR